MIATSWLAPDAWRARQEEAIREAVAAGADWREYLALVDRHRTPALSWAALTGTPDLEIPNPVRQELQKRDRACRVEALRHAMVLAEVLKDFNRAEIPVIPLKGPLLSLELYGDTGIRQSWDLDVLVTDRDFPRAAKRLEEMGWRTMPSASFLASLTPRQTAAVWRHKHDVGYMHAQKGALELHRSILPHRPEQTEGCWPRSVPGNWSGASFRRMDAIDLAVHLCEHGSIHLWFRAKWLGDLARMYAIEHVDWQAAFDRAQEVGQERSVLLALRLLNEAYGLPLPPLLAAPAIQLHPLLIRQSVLRLQAADNPAAAPSLRSFRDRLRRIRAERLLRPHKSWRQTFSEFACCPEDYATIRLPDWLFWAYVPLRPVLWMIRVLRRSSPSLRGAGQTAP